MGTKNNITIGSLILILLVSGIMYVTFDAGGVKLRVDEDKSTFYVFNENNSRWQVSGREYNKMYDGTKRMYRDASNILLEYTNDSSTITIKRTTPFKRGPIVIDTYEFNGNITDVELFPISHTIELINATGYIYQYEVRDLKYGGLTIKNPISPLNFGMNMKVEWDDQAYWSTVYKSGILKVRYKPQSDYEVYSVRLFDPIPGIETVTILPSPAYINNDLEGYCNATDDDGDNVEYHYKWYKDGLNIYRISTFNNSENAEFLEFTGSSNNTRYLKIDKESRDIEDATIDINGIIKVTSLTENSNCAITSGNPRSITAYDNYIWIADISSGNITKYDTACNIIDTWVYSSCGGGFLNYLTTNGTHLFGFNIQNDYMYTWTIDGVCVSSCSLTSAKHGIAYDWNTGYIGAYEPFTGGDILFYDTACNYQTSESTGSPLSYDGIDFTNFSLWIGDDGGGQDYIRHHSRERDNVNSYSRAVIVGTEDITLDYTDSTKLYVIQNWGASSLYNFTITKAFPSNTYLEVGTPDGTYEWNSTVAFSSTETTDNLADAINTALNSGACDCTGCVIDDTYCNIPFLFHSDTNGYLGYSNLNIDKYINTTFYTEGVEINVVNISNNELTSDEEWILSCRANDTNGDLSAWTNSSITTILTYLTLSLNGVEDNYSIELGSTVTINATIPESETVCVDIDHPDYGVNYSCAVDSVEFDVNFTYSRNNEIDGLTALNWTYDDSADVDRMSNNETTEELSMDCATSHCNVTRFINVSRYASFDTATLLVLGSGECKFKTLSSHYGEYTNMRLRNYDNILILANGTELIPEQQSYDFVGVGCNSYYWNWEDSYDNDFNSYADKSVISNNLCTGTYWYTWVSIPNCTGLDHKYRLAYDMNMSYWNGTDYNLNFSDSDDATPPTWTVGIDASNLEATTPISDPFIEVGTPDGDYDWEVSGEFPSSTTVDITAGLTTALNNGNCDCTGCVIDGNICQIPIIFSAINDSTMTYDDIVVSYSTNETFYISSHQYDEIQHNVSINLTGYEYDGSFPSGIHIYINNTLSNTIGPLSNTTAVSTDEFSDGTTSNNFVVGQEITAVYYFKLPKISTVTEAILNVTGSNNYGNWDNTEDSWEYNGTANSPSYCVDEDFSTAGFASGGNSFYVYENYTWNDEWSDAMKWDFAYFIYNSGTFDLAIWNYTDSSWETIDENSATGVPYREVKTFNRTDFGLSASDPFQIRSSVSAGGFGSTSYTEGQLNWQDMPSGAWMEVGILDGVYEWNSTGDFTTTETSNDFAAEINYYLSICTADDEGFCTIPVYVYSVTNGNMTLDSVEINYTHDPNPVILNLALIQAFLNNSVGATEIPITIDSLTAGLISISDIRYDYSGGNDSIEVKAHNVDYGANITFNIINYYSDWSLGLPPSILAINFFPWAPNAKNVTPFGQTDSIGIFNISGENYGGKTFNFSVQIPLINEERDEEEAYACQSGYLCDIDWGHPYRAVDEDFDTLWGSGCNECSAWIYENMTYNGADNVIWETKFASSYTHAWTADIDCWSYAGDAWYDLADISVPAQTTVWTNTTIHGQCLSDGNPIQIKTYRPYNLAGQGYLYYYEGRILQSNLSDIQGCVNITISNTSNKSDGALLTDFDTNQNTWNYVYAENDYLENFYLWLWADYDCSYTTWQLWEPTYYFKACCEDCGVCDLDTG